MNEEQQPVVEQEEQVTDFNDLNGFEQQGLSSPQASKLAFYTSTTNPNGSGNIVSDFVQSKFNMETTGTDPSTDNNIQRYAEEYKMIRSQSIAEVANRFDLTPEQKAIKAQELAANDLMINPEQEFQLEQADSGNTPYTSLDQVILTDQIADKMVNDRLSELREARGERTWLSGIGDILLSSVPFAYNETILDVAEALIPQRLSREDDALIYTDVEEGTIGYLTGPGDVSTMLRQEYEKLQGPAKIEFIAKMTEVLKENAGYTDNSLFIQEFILGSVMQPFLDGEIAPDSQTGWDIADNVFYGLDLVGVGQAAKGAMKAGARLLDTPMASLASSNPRAASELAQAAMGDPKIAEAMNMTKAQLVEFLLPGVDPKGVMNIERLKKSAATGESIIKLAKNEAFSYSQKEIEASFPHFLQTIAKSTKLVHSPNASTVVFDRGTGTNFYNAVYLGADEIPFKTLQEATDMGKAIFPDGFEVKGWDRGSEVITDVLPTTDSFVINIKGAEQVNISNMEKDILSLNDGNSFRNGLMTPITAPSGKLAKEVIGTAWTGLRKESIMNAKFIDMLQPYVHLKRNMIKEGSNPFGARKKVANKWIQGSKENKIYTEAELLEQDFTPAMMNGYYAGIQVNNTQYVINNAKLYTRLNNDGYMNIVNAGQDYMNVAKPYVKSDANPVRTIYDASADAIVEYDPKTMTNVAQLKAKVTIDNNSTIFALIDDSTSLVPLTKTPLKYNEGYIPRHYDNLYFITGANKQFIHNGEDVVVNSKNISQHGSVLHGVDSIAEANRIIRNLERDNPDMIFGSVLDRNTFNDIQGVRFSEEEYMLQSNRGNIHQRGRGAQLGKDKFSGILEQTEIDDPVTAIMSSFHNLTRGAAMGDMTNSMKQRWLNDYGYLTNKQFPVHANEIVARETSAGKDVVAAKSYFNYINTLEGYGGYEATKWRQWMLGFGQWIEGKNLHTLGAATQKIGKVDPTKRIRGLAFNMMIAGNPLRQAAIQTMQFTQLAGIDPKFMLVGLPRVVAFRKSLFLKPTGLGEMYEQSLKEGAKVFKTTVKEYKALLKEFEDSGLVAEIGAQTLSRDSLRNVSQYAQSATTLGKGYQRVRQAASVPFALGRKAGFEFGEANARAHTWLIARRGWEKKNPNGVMNYEARQEVNNLTEALVFSMNKGDKFWYQDGLAGLVMQFMSIQNKALMNMMPTSIGGSKFTEGYKMRLALGNALMFGAQGLALTELANLMMDKYDVDENVRAGIEGGLMELAINSTLDTDMDITKNFAPTSEMYGSFTKFLGAMITGDKPLYEIPPAAHSMDRFNNIRKMFTEAYKNGDLYTQENMSMYITEVAKLASGNKNFLQSAAMFRTKHFVDKYGSPTDKRRYADNITAAFKAFGISDKESNDKWTAINAGTEFKEDVKTSAKDYYEYLKRKATDKGTKVADEIVMSFKVRTEGMPTSKAIAFTNAVWQLIEYDSKSEAGSGIADIVIKNAMQGMSGPPGTAQLNWAKSKGYITDEQYNDLNKQYTMQGL